MAVLNRREFLGAVSVAAAAQTPPRKPNIIWIMADDLGYGDLGCYGQSKGLRTPNIDRIAAEGVRFTQVYAASTVCAPSRCGLMSGKHMGHATVRGNMRPEAGLSPDEPAVSEILKGAGYHTGIFGKWGLGGPWTKGTPNDRGFDEWFGYLDQVHAHEYYPEHLWENRKQVFLRGNRGSRREEYSHDKFTPKALDFMRRHKDEPFFLYLPYTIPHANNEGGRTTGDGMDVPDYGSFADKDWPTPEKGFAAMIERLDRDVGLLMEELKTLGIDDNTIVFFTSDNGPHREGGHDPEFFESRGPLRGIKRDLYEGGIRVPLLARWPGRIEAGSVSDQVWAFWDFLPTAAELAGVSAPQGIDGISMAPALLGRPQTDHEYLYWEFHERGFKQAIRMGRWKGVRLGTKKPLELYDLAGDVGEQNDVAARRPEIAKKITELMTTARVDSELFPIREGT